MGGSGGVGLRVFVVLFFAGFFFSRVVRGGFRVFIKLFCVFFGSVGV